MADQRVSFRRQSAKGDSDDVASPNRASTPIYVSLRRTRPARNRLDLHDADGSCPAINIPVGAVIWVSNRIAPDDMVRRRSENESTIARSSRAIQICPWLDSDEYGKNSE